MARYVCAEEVVAPGGIVSGGWVAVDEGRITAVGDGAPPAGAGDEVDRVEGTVVPGFVDLHCHGGGGAAYTSADPEQILTAAQTHLRHGTTTTNASLVSATLEDLTAQIEALIPFVDDGTIHGIHLEGPWISPEYCGAHDPATLRPPDPSEVAEVLAAGGGRIAMVTLAPELPGALESIPLIVEAGGIAAVGHTASDADQARAAVDAGAAVATHLFNAMPPLLHRSPGPVGALMSDPRVVVELICDGVHLSPDVVALAMGAASGRCALITDAMSAAGAADGEYLIGNLDVIVRDGEARLATNGSLAGSTLLMGAAVRTAAIAAGRGIEQASRAASAVPAMALGLGDRGRLEPGLRADLVCLDDDLRVTRVMRAGHWVT